MTVTELLYYPCIWDSKTCRISRRVSVAMTREQAENYLQVNHARLWLRGEAIPQLTTHHYFKG